jgi:hypothetical protein
MVQGDLFDDGEVENIKLGHKRRLYVWGTVVYEEHKPDWLGSW